MGTDAPGAWADGTGDLSGIAGIVLLALLMMATFVAGTGLTVALFGVVSNPPAPWPRTTDAFPHA